MPIADDEDSAINTLALSISAIFSLTIIIFLLLLIAGEEFLSLFDGQELIKYKLLIPIGVFLTGLYAMFTQRSYKEKDYKITSKKTAQSIAQNVTKLIAGIIGLGPAGLIIGNIIGQSAGIIALIKSFLTSTKKFVKLINLNSINLFKYSNQH